MLPLSISVYYKTKVLTLSKKAVKPFKMEQLWPSCTYVNQMCSIPDVCNQFRELYSSRNNIDENNHASLKHFQVTTVSIVYVVYEQQHVAIPSSGLKQSWLQVKRVDKLRLPHINPLP